MTSRTQGPANPAVTDWSLFGGAEVVNPALSQAATGATPPSTDSASSSDTDDAPTATGASYKLAGEQWVPKMVVPEQDPSDWLWMMTEEPHRTRRKAILKAHPEVRLGLLYPLLYLGAKDRKARWEEDLDGATEKHGSSGGANSSSSSPQIKKLMGREPLTKWISLFVTALQFTTAYLLRSTPVLSPTFLLATYLIGGTANQNVFLSIHEITHNLAFKGVRANRLFAIFANLPIGVPFAMMFKKVRSLARRGRFRFNLSIYPFIVSY